MRSAANSENIQVVHLEILQFLSISNRYSNTAQAMTEYLGQTKGSISQSLKVLEKEDFIERKPCSKDKRVTRLYLTNKGNDCLQRMLTYLPSTDETAEGIEFTKSLLLKWQAQNSNKGFGQCRSCRFNNKQSSGTFQCGLTEETLTETDINLICREHQFDT
ncbi:MAG: MarR family winged helix-turn-helix transcriptional regulator [Oceanospirillaceae bacterium]